MTEPEYVAVFHGDSLLEAELIKGLLEAEGVSCTIPGELATDHQTAARQVTGGRQLDVRVAPEDLGRARDVILQAIRDGERLQGYLAEHPDDAPGADDTPPEGT